MRMKSKLRQFAVYWGPGAIHEDTTVFSQPIEVRCRWEDITQLMTDQKGDQWASKSAVDTGEVRVQVNGVLWKGKLADIVTGSESDPMSNPGAAKIQAIDGIPGVRAKQTLYTAYL